MSRKPETKHGGPPDDPSEADLIALRNAAIAHGELAVAASLDQTLEARGAPDLYRHSRRR
jgi:hypothetical protein